MNFGLYNVHRYVEVLTFDSSVSGIVCLRFAPACENFGTPLLRLFELCTGQESPLKVTCQKVHGSNNNQIRNPILGTSL